MQQKRRESGYKSLEGVLSTEHRAYLHECSISDEIIDGRPYQTLTNPLRKELLKKWGFAPEQLDPEGIVIRRYDVATGEETFPQVRYSETRIGPDGTAYKYCAPPNSGGVVDVHPDAWERVMKTLEPLWLAESVKGGDAIYSCGGLAISFFGVAGYSRDRRIAEALTKVPMRNRVVNIAFDSDIRDAGKRGPLFHLNRLCYYLVHAQGATVNIAEVPLDVDGSKLGIDDVLPFRGEVR